MIDKGIRADIWQDDIRGSMELCWAECRKKLLQQEREKNDRAIDRKS